MDENWLKLEDAALRYGLVESTLRRLLNTGKLSGRKVPWGKRERWEIHESTLEALTVESGSYESLVKEWEQDQANGHHSGEPLSPRTIERNTYGLKAFWKNLGQKASVNGVTVENVRRSIANTPKEEKGARENTYKSVMSFYRFLIRKKLRPSTDIYLFKDFKPKPNSKPKRTFVKNHKTFQEMLKENEDWTTSRPKWKVKLTRMVLMLAYYTGMRNTEMCDLMCDHIDLENDIILVVNGKGGKSRPIGIEPELKAAIQEYLPARAIHAAKKNSKYKNFLLQLAGNPLTRRVLNDCVKSVSLKTGDKVTAHGFRRTLITKLLVDGVPSVLVQKIVDHKQLSTTQKYDMSTQEQALDVLRKRGLPPEAPEAETKEEMPQEEKQPAKPALKPKISLPEWVNY